MTSVFVEPGDEHTVFTSFDRLIFTYLLEGSLGFVVKAAGWQSFDLQFEAVLRAYKVGPSWCGLQCCSWTDDKNDIFFFGHKNSLFGHNRFSTLFFSMKVAESEIIVLANCILDFNDIQVWLRHFSLNLNDCRVMMVFYKIWPGILKKTIITRQVLRFKLNCLDKLVYL